LGGTGKTEEPLSCEHSGGGKKGIALKKGKRKRRETQGWKQGKKEKRGQSKFYSFGYCRGDKIITVGNGKNA